MKQALMAGALVAALVLPAALLAQTAGTSLGSVTLNKKVMADGQPLAPGTYQVRLTGDIPKPVPNRIIIGGASAASSCARKSA